MPLGHKGDIMYLVMGRRNDGDTEEVIAREETLEKAEAVMEHEYPAWDSIWIDPPNRRPDPDHERWLTFEQRS